MLAPMLSHRRRQKLSAAITHERPHAKNPTGTRGCYFGSRGGLRKYCKRPSPYKCNVAVDTTDDMYLPRMIDAHRIKPVIKESVSRQVGISVSYTDCVIRENVQSLLEQECLFIYLFIF